MLQFAGEERERSQFVISWVGQSEVATTVVGNMRVTQ
jgi:hypothetical protein